MQEQLREKAKSMVKESDLMHKGFLKPMEMALRTYKNDKSGFIKQGQLPKGLKIVLKREGIQTNNYQLLDINPIPARQNNGKFQKISYDDFINNNYNNIISIIKSFNQIQIAICVCMYSEEKKLLKSTLSGIGENLQNIVKKNGVNPDKVAIFIIMDGIQHVDHSVAQYIEELQRESEIEFRDDIEPLGINDLIKNQGQNIFGEPNVNNLLFDPYELKQRKACRFNSRKQQYMEFKQLKKKIAKWKWDKTLTYQQLQPRIQEFFVTAARQDLKIESGLTDEEANKWTEEKILEKYAYNTKISRPIIISALLEADRYCSEYINKREDLAYVSIYRTSVLLEQDLIQSLKQSQMKEQHQNLISTESQQTHRSVKMNLFFFVKYRNSGKLSSHNWFFNGFCQELKPKYALLIDVGLRPEAMALYKMYNYLINNHKVGGVCGYMGLKREKLDDDDDQKFESNIDFFSSLILKFVDIQRAQQMEYHFAHLVDKPFQASFGFIHVLPGAFSGYNLRALKSSSDADDKLLKEYFKSIGDKLSEGTKQSTFTPLQIFLRILFPQILYKCFFGEIDEKSQQQLLYDENIYLAQDRILCMGIHKNGWDMAFLPDAYAWVDPIKTVHGLLGQRKRWINGSYFAFEKVKKQLSRHEQLNGTCELCLRLQIVYLTFMNVLAYVAPALFLFTISIAMQAFQTDFLNGLFGGDNRTSFITNIFVPTINFIYVIMIMGMIFFSLHLTNRNQQFIPYIYIISSSLGLFALIIFTILTVDIIRGLLEDTSFLAQSQNGQLPGGQVVINALRYIVIGIMALYVIPIITYSISYGNRGFLTEMVFGTISFLFFGPTYLNMLNIYALCRIDDISWGTKGLDQQTGGKNVKLKETWKIVKYIHVSKFVFWNIVAAVVLLFGSSNYAARFYITFVIMVILLLTLFTKVFIGVMYLIFNSCSQSQKGREKNSNFQSQVEIFFQGMKPQIQKQVYKNIDGLAEDLKIDKCQNKSYITFNTKNPKRLKEGYRKNQESYIIKNTIQTSKILAKKKIQAQKQKQESGKKILKEAKIPPKKKFGNSKIKKQRQEEQQVQQSAENIISDDLQDQSLEKKWKKSPI